MKKYAVILFLAFFFSSASSTVAQTHYQQGRALLFTGGELTVSNAVAAQPEFEAAVNENPSHQPANLFLAACRLLALLDNNATYSAGPPIENMRELFDGLGLDNSGRELFDWTADFIHDPGGAVTVPENCPNGADLQTFFHTMILPVIDESLQNLSAIGDSILFSIYAAEIGESQDIEVDYGDVLMFRALLHAAKAAVLVLSSYNANVDVYQIVEKVNSGLFHFNTDLIDNHTDFLKLLDTGYPCMLEAKGELISAIGNYLSASEFMRSETDNQADDLIQLDAAEPENEEEFRNQITEVKNSLIQERIAVLDIDNDISEDHIDFNHFFGTSTVAPLILRNIFPVFDINGNIHAGTFPDTTFGGILPDCIDEQTLLQFAPFEIPIVETVLGDLSADGNVDLTDAILVLQIISGMNPAGFQLHADVNGDSKTGMMEAFYILHKISGLRNEECTKLIAHYEFNGNANDSMGINGPAVLKNTEFISDSLYLNGVYEYCSKATGYSALAPIPYSDFDAFSISLDFKPYEWKTFPAGQNCGYTLAILTGGVTGRWIRLKQDFYSGSLALTLNNSPSTQGGYFEHIFNGTNLEANQWHNVVVSINLINKTIITFLDGIQLENLSIPSNFKLNTYSQNKISFADYSNANTFSGLVDNLKVYDGALRANEIRELYDFQ